MSRPRTTLLERPVEAPPRTREIHIACDDDWDTALCGKKRDRPWWEGSPSKEATCVVCLDLYEGQVRDA